MRVIITKNMTVANGRGEAQAFEESDEPITIGDVQTYRRLNRAGAAVLDLTTHVPSDDSQPGPVGAAEMTVAYDADGKPSAGGGDEVLDLKALQDAALESYLTGGE